MKYSEADLAVIRRQQEMEHENDESDAWAYVCRRCRVISTDDDKQATTYCRSCGGPAVSIGIRYGEFMSLPDDKRAQLLLRAFEKKELPVSMSRYYLKRKRHIILMFTIAAVLWIAFIIHLFLNVRS